MRNPKTYDDPMQLRSATFGDADHNPTGCLVFSDDETRIVYKLLRSTARSEIRNGLGVTYGQKWRSVTYPENIWAVGNNCWRQPKTLSK